MKITFDESGFNFVEFSKKEDGVVCIVLSSRDHINPNKTIVNSVELTPEDFMKLVQGITAE